MPFRHLAALALVCPLVLAGCGGGSSDRAGRLPDLVSRQVTAASPRADAPVRVGTSPTAIAVGEGGVWVANNAAGTVSRLDPGTGRRAGQPVRVGPGPRAVATGEGAVWVLAGTGDVVRIDPAGGPARRVARVPGAAGVAAGQGGVWVSSRSTGHVVRLDPRDGRVEARIRVGGIPTDVAIAGGRVWAAGRPGAVVGIDPETNRPGDPVRVARRQVLGLAAGGDRLWVVKTDHPLADPIGLVRVDARTGSVDGSALRVPARIPARVAAGGGSVWVTDAGNLVPPAPRRAPGLTRVDPTRSAIAGRPIRVGSDPAGIAVGAGAVWVANAGDGTVSRIPLA